MEVCTTIEGIRKAVARARAAGGKIGLVPTMGALHAGHASLIDAAAGGTDFVVVSIFVNPIQFGPSEDFSRYPRTPQVDSDLCSAHGAGAIFMPSVDEMYPGGGNLVDVSVRQLGDRLCGASRPGHFTGVCTVVAKLFNIVLPDKAYFGAKDFQQATILQRMAADLNFPLEIVVCPIVREADGLAMSSRNRYLSAQERTQALALSGSLSIAREMILAKGLEASAVVQAMKEYIHRHAPLGQIEYIEACDSKLLSPVESTGGAVLLALAVRFGSTRLIDNMVVSG